MANPAFRVDDLILARQLDYDVNGGELLAYEIRAKVVNINAAGDVDISIESGLEYIDRFGEEAEFVRVGSATDANRRGGVYLSSDDDNAPFIRVWDGVSSFSLWGAASTIKAQMGRLDGITDTNFGTLTGYGFYTPGNAYIKGYIAGGSATAITTGTGYWIDPSGSARFGNPSGQYIYWNQGAGTLTVNGVINVTGGNAATTSYVDSGDNYIKQRQIVGVGGTFSADDYDTVSWTGVTIYFASGSKTVTDGNTGNMAAGKNFLYVDASAAAPLTMQITTNPAVLGGNNVLVAVAEKNSDTTQKASVQVVGGGTLIGPGWIVTGTLSAISANLGAITAGSLTSVLIRTAESGKRFEINYTDANEATFFDGLGNKIIRIGEAVYGTQHGIEVLNGGIIRVVYTKPTSIGVDVAITSSIGSVGINSTLSGTASGSSFQYGIKGACSVLANGFANTNIGVYGYAAQGAVNWAGYFDAGDVYIKNQLKIDTTSAPLIVASTTKVTNLHVDKWDDADLGAVSTVNPTNPNRTIAITISGTTYYLHAKTTND